MPELPDITVYIESLHSRIAGRKLARIRLVSPFLLRTYEPRIEALFGRRVEELCRVGKRIVFCLEDEYFLVLHLMIAGRLHWKRPGAGVPGRIGLCALDFENGSLVLTESGSRRRASLHVVRGADELKAFDPGGVEVLKTDFQSFRNALLRSAHTLFSFAIAKSANATH